MGTGPPYADPVPPELVSGPDGAPRLPASPPVVAVASPPVAWAGLARPAPPPAREPRLWATLVFGVVAVVAAVFACFAPWATYADGAWRSGMDTGDGWYVLVAAFAAAGLCGAVVAGLRHLGARLALAACGVAVFVCYEANRWRVTHAADQVTGATVEVGGGLYVLAFAALGLVIAALAMPSAPWWSTRRDRAEDTSTTT